MAYYLHNYLYKFSKYGKSNYPWKMNIIFSPYQIFITNFQIRQSHGVSFDMPILFCSILKKLSEAWERVMVNLCVFLEEGYFMWKIASELDSKGSPTFILV